MIQLKPSFFEILIGFLWCFALISWGIGLQGLLRKFIPRWKISVCNAFALGCSVSVPVFMVFVLLPNPVLMTQLWAGLGIILFLFTIKELQPLPKQLRQGWSRGTVFLGLVGVIPFLLTLPVLFQPQLSFDLLSYHLPIAYELAAGKGLGVNGFDYYRNLPLSPMLLYLPVLSDPASTIDDPGVRVLIWCTWLFTALAVGRLAGNLGGRRKEQALGFLLVGYSLMFIGILLNSNSDVLTSAVVVSGISWLLSGLSACKSPQQNLKKMTELMLGGLLVGAAYGLKQSAFALVIIPTICFILVSLFILRPNKKRAAQLAGMSFLGLFLSIGPWAIRSFMIAGNPLYPLAGNSSVWSAEQQDFLQAQHHVFSPFSVGYFGELIKNLDVWGFPLSVYRFNEETTQMEATTFLIALIYPLLAVWLFARNKRLSHALIFLLCALGFGAWCLVGEAPSRFMAPLVALIAALSAVMIGQAHVLIARRGVWIFAAGVIFLNAWRVAGVDQNGLPGMLRYGWFEEAWSRDGIFPTQVIETQHQQNGKTWLIFENRERFFAPPVLSNKVWNPLPFFSEHEIRSVDELIELAKADGISTVLVNDAELRRFVQFYGADKTSVGETGIRSGKEEYARLIENYPPVNFSGMDRQEIMVFVEFLRLCRFQALRTVQTGPSSEIWISPLPSTNESFSPSP